MIKYDDKMIFAPEPKKKKKHSKDEEPWNIIVADDEGMVHMVTEMALRDYEFEDRPIKLHSTYSAKETVEAIKKFPDGEKIAIILLDVVMESLDAGLKAVPLIREGNREVRIIIRTGQAGRTALTDIIHNYDVNDIHEKTALDHTKLINVVTLALRNYRDICDAKLRGAEDCDDAKKS